MINLTSNMIKVSIAAVIMTTLVFALLVPIVSTVGSDSGDAPTPITEHYENVGVQYRGELFDGYADGETLVSPPTITWDFTTAGSETVTFNNETHSVADFISSAPSPTAARPFALIFGYDTLIGFSLKDKTNGNVTAEAWTFSIESDQIKFVEWIDGVANDHGYLAPYRGIWIACDDGDYAVYNAGVPSEGEPATFYVSDLNDVSGYQVPNPTAYPYSVYRSTFATNCDWVYGEDGTLPLHYTELSNGVGTFVQASSTDRMKVAYDQNGDGSNVTEKGMTYYMLPIEFDYTYTPEGDDDDDNSVIVALVGLIPLAIVLGFVLMVFRGSFVGKND